MAEENDFAAGSPIQHVDLPTRDQVKRIRRIALADDDFALAEPPDLVMLDDIVDLRFAQLRDDIGKVSRQHSLARSNGNFRTDQVALDHKLQKCIPIHHQ